MTFVKICGITTPEDAAVAVEAGANAIGIIFAASKRQVDTRQACAVREAVPGDIPLVGVFMDQPLAELRSAMQACSLDWVQLHGNEPRELAEACQRPIIKRHDIPSAGREALERQVADYDLAAWQLLDPGAGSGRTFDWRLARDLPGRIMVSGGLRPDNVRAAMQASAAEGVDVASGVEDAPGRKNHALIRRFLEEVRAHDADSNDSN